MVMRVQAGLAGLAGDDGLDVISLAGEQPGDLAEDAGDVLDQQGEGVELLFWIKVLFIRAAPLLAAETQ